MQKKLIAPILLSTIIGSMAVSCNSSNSSYDIEYTESGSVLVSGFSLTSDKNVLDSLENVFFSIDLVNGRIFNADSLPYGTKVSKLIPKISTPATASEVTLQYYCEETKRDSVVNYLTNSTDSIDFSHGPVTLTVVSQSKSTTKKYEIKVNVHNVKADSLAWYTMESAPLPFETSAIKASATAAKGSTYYCLTTDGSTYSMAYSSDPAASSWTAINEDFGFTPRTETLRGTADALYILSTDNKLYSSTDAKTWKYTGREWQYIYGEYCSEVFGYTLEDGQRYIQFFPSGKRDVMPADFPVEGTSLPASYKVPMGFSTQLVMLGGRRANGTLVRGAWGYDGTTWAEVTSQPIPTDLEYVTMVPYKLVKVPSSTWSPYDYPVLLAIGGRTVKGELNELVYYSRDWGMTWELGDNSVQIPEEIPMTYGAFGFEHISTMHAASRSSYWTGVNVPALPAGASYELPAAQSRATAPITQWECPQIYMFGGRYANNTPCTTIWRGVITYFTFKPVQ